jgi:hypothetical protein
MEQPSDSYCFLMEKIEKWEMRTLYSRFISSFRPFSSFLWQL